jgi:hypothetical protein
MQPIDPSSRDELSRVEQRLAQWSPSAPALDRDRMLFEAGRASARTARAGQVVAALGAVLAVSFGVWGAHERSQRKALELALTETTRALKVAQSARPVVPPSIRLPELTSPAPQSYLALSHRPATLGGDELRKSSAPSRFPQLPAGLSQGLTPLSARRPGALTDL